ncbi:MAG: MarR family transcriptional regulator [Dehalococcoidia bacterium]|nr:MarR family transcriptional regulator [Dehalococcoidia bacterium]
MNGRAERSIAGLPGLSEHERAWENLALTWITLHRAREIELGKVGLTVPQAAILDLLKTSTEPLTPMKLARRLNRKPHTVSALVSRMETEGLVRTTRDMGRRNWVRVSLTKKGEQAWSRQAEERTARGATACLSKKELDQLNTICRKLRTRGSELIRQMQLNPYGDFFLQ